MHSKNYRDPSSNYADSVLNKQVKSGESVGGRDSVESAHHRLPGNSENSLVRNASSNVVVGQSFPDLYPVVKRSLDVVVSLVALLFVSPLCLVIAALIWAEDGGKIFYAHTRVGRDGRPFRFYKFRSMVENADELKEKLAEFNEATGPVFKMREDPRITRIGRALRKTSLDELPQFWNVLRGDMSLIGPRPHLPKEVALYTEEQAVRLSVPPGLICLREITGRSNLTFDRWIETDLQYVRTRSLSTDLKILWRAVPAVLKGDGAY